MNSRGHARSLRTLLTSARREGAVSVIFATSFVALLMMVGLAVDYSFYNEAETQLDMAADSAAIHAVRIAVEAIQQNQSNYIAQGQAAATQWFLAQAGTVPQAMVVNTPSVSVSFNTSTNLLTAQVSYTGIIATHFGGIFPVHWTNWPNWGIAGTATAVQSAESYIEFVMLLDNSSSMLIAADGSGIASMDALTPCSVQAAGAAQAMDGTYSWVYNTTTAYGGPNNNSSQVAQCGASTTYTPYGFGTFSYSAKVKSSSGSTLTCGGSSTSTLYANELVPPTNKVQGACDSAFTGPTSGSTNQCPYVPQIVNMNVVTTSTGSYAQCVNSAGTPYGGGQNTGTNSTGSSSTNYYPTSATKTQSSAGTLNNVPQAPCAFACHWTSSLLSGTNYSNDYYGLARQNNITLRFDVVQSAAATVINDLISYLPNSPVPAPFEVGVYTFNTALGTIYQPPATPVTTATGEQAELNAALTAINGYTTPVVANSADTDFPDSMASLSALVTQSGNGSSAANPRKNLFIVTDGMSDYNAASGRLEGPIDTTQCTNFKNLGFTIYVLYTVYYPLPNEYYLQNIKQFAEPTNTSSIVTALQSCASYPSTFFQASDSASINAAMQEMLRIALTSPGRLAQ